jgi:hypothetical protein
MPQAPKAANTRAHTAHMCLYTARGFCTGCMRREGGCGGENGTEPIWLIIFVEELISVNFSGEKLISVISRIDYSRIGFRYSHKTSETATKLASVICQQDFFQFY